MQCISATFTMMDMTCSQIPVPELNRQKEFSTFVSQVDKSKSVVQKSLDKMQLLFDSLMQQYFG